MHYTDEVTDAAEPARALPRSSAALFLDDGDRAFLYRAVAVHAVAGVAPAEALAAISAALSGTGDGFAAGVMERRSRGAALLREGVVAALAAPGDRADAAIVGAGYHLGPLERACLSLPPRALADPPVAAALFDALADLFRAEAHR